MGIGMGRANDRVARLQETYVTNATNGWLESLERSLVMMKEYQVCHDFHNSQFVGLPEN